MSAKILGAFCGLMGLLAGCGAAVDGALTQDELTTTRIVHPNEINKNGVINIGLNRDVSIPTTFPASPGNSGGYAMQTGAIDNQGLFAVSGLFAGTNVSQPPSGSAIYAGTFNLIEITDIEIADNPITGSPEINGERGLQSGDLTLVASFSDDWIRSTPGSELTVDGRLIGTDIVGIVQYNGIDGSLEGMAGGDQAIGAFHGEGNVGPGTADDYMFAGGFIADRAF
jgi:hypothetical protein